MDKKPVKIAVFNQKGGVGKTTSVINIAGILAKKGKKVLLVDADPQANTTSTMLMENIAEYERDTKKSFYDNHLSLVEVLENPKMINDSIIKAKIIIKDGCSAKWRGIDVLPSKRSLAGIEIQDNYDMAKAINKIKRTRGHSYDYDFIFFDLPPYLSDLSINVLSAADYVLVPATVDKDSLEGYSDLIDTVANIRLMGINPNLKLLGVFLTMINAQTKYDKQLYNKVKESLGNIFIDVPVRWNANAKLASHIGCPLCWFKRTLEVTKDYEVITEEILKRCGFEIDEYEHKENIDKITTRYVG